MKNKERKEQSAVKKGGGKRAVLFTYAILDFTVLIILIRSIMLGNYEHTFVCLLVLALFTIPFFVRKKLKIEIPGILEIIILLFIFASEILGELGNYFIQYKNWDTLLHTTSGFLLAAVGFSLFDILNKSEKLKFELSPSLISLCSLCFSVTTGVIWEFFECGVDLLFGKDMQKDTVITFFNSTYLDPTGKNIPISISGITDTVVNGTSLGINGYLDIGLYDTMEDLAVNLIGAFIFAVIGYIYLKNRGGNRIISGLVPTKKRAEDGTEGTETE